MTWLQGLSPHTYPPQPPTEVVDVDPRATTSKVSAAVSGSRPLSPLPPPVISPASPSVDATEVEAENKLACKNGSGSRCHNVCRFTAAINRNKTELEVQGLMFTLCALMVIAAVCFSLRPVPLGLFEGTAAAIVEASIFQYASMKTLVWSFMVPPTDCAIPQKGARVVPDLTSPGIGDSRRLFRTVFGLTAVPAEAVLDPHLPHWSFFGRSGYITLELHSNATLTTIVIESDFPDSMPHNIRVWALVPRLKQDLYHSQLPAVPPFPFEFKGQDFSPLLLGDSSFQTGSSLGERRYRVPRGSYGHVPIGMVTLEFLSNGGNGNTRIGLIRVLGSPL